MKLSDSANLMSSAILVAMIVNMKSLSLYHLKLGWELSWVAALDAYGTRFSRDLTIGWIIRYILMELLNAALRVAAAYELVPRWSEYNDTQDHCYRALPTNHISNSESASIYFVGSAWMNSAFTLTLLPRAVGFDCRRIPQWVMRRLSWELNTKTRKWLICRRLGRWLWGLWVMAVVCLMAYFAGQVLVDVWTMAILNKLLLGDDEIKWGFGQVIAMSLLFNLIYGMFLDCISMYILFTSQVICNLVCKGSS